MSDIIKLLPESLANQIAAGEVVQRPASVIKELLENAIDAGATSIQVVVKEAGRQLIQVIDNGKGMSDSDARMCFERHATSKLATTEDLFRIKTLGFRGEAMASIAAVAQVEMRSKQAADELGTRIVIEGSQVKVQEQTAAPDGTSISVKNLFFNVPARRNFLKSNAVEMRHILEEFQRVALANPQVAFSLYNNDLEVFNLPAGKLSQRIVNVFGPQYKEQMARCEEETSVVKVQGYIGKPEYAKKSRGEQYFFVNNRFIKSAYLHHAVANAYEELLPKDSHPFYVLFLEMEPKQIDINVHPTKTEIKFEDEKLVYAVVKAAVKKALGQHNITPSIDFGQDVNFMQFGGGMANNEPPARQQPLTQPDAGGLTPTQAFLASLKRQPGPETNEEAALNGSREKTEGFGFSNYQAPPRPNQNWQQLYEPLKNAGPFTPANQAESDVSGSVPAKLFGSAGISATQNQQPELMPGTEAKALDVHQRYVFTQVKSGVMIIDRQAAQERILYEKYQTEFEQNKGASQQLLFPQVIQLSAQDFNLAQEIMPELQQLGFDLSDFGNRSLLVQGMPAGLGDVKEQELIEGLLEQYKLNQTTLKLDKIESLTRAMARRTAQKAAGRMSPAEVTALIDKLFACQVPAYAPSGNKTLVILELDNLAGLFTS